MEGRQGSKGVYHSVSPFLSASVSPDFPVCFLFGLKLLSVANDHKYVNLLHSFPFLRTFLD